MFNRFFVVRVVLGSLVAFVSSFPVAIFAQNEPPLKPGVWHYKSVPCVNTTVFSVRPRLQSVGQKTFSAADYEQSGVVVVLKTELGVDPARPGGHASVTHYQNLDGNDVMMSERQGDRVQVCFLGAPPPTQFCDPDRDPRGRMYRVYDYRQHASYSGWNSEHACGGA